MPGPYPGGGGDGVDVCKPLQSPKCLVFSKFPWGACPRTPLLPDGWPVTPSLSQCGPAKRTSQFKIIINVLVSSFRFIWILRPFQCGDRLYTSESDVYRRQILTYKDGPRAKRVDVNISDNYFIVTLPFNRQNIQPEFSPTLSCVSLTRSTTSSEWKLFGFDKMAVNFFHIMLFDVTFYL